MRTMQLVYLLVLCGCLVSPAMQSVRAEGSTDFCISCHSELDDELGEPAAKFSSDAHNIEGVSCAGCHGGDPGEEYADLAMSASRGFVASPEAAEIPEFCGKCHADPVYMRSYNPSIATDQLEKYWTSHHGEKIRRGDKKAAQCVSCHGAHDIRPAADPRSSVYAKNVPQTCSNCHSDPDYMAAYKIETDQLEQYRTSMHGLALLEKNDLAAPACNDCHGNHAATPPGISSIGRVCFQCHLAEGELFSGSPHKDAFDDLGVPECAFCHGNHDVHALSDQHIGIDEQSICIECHSEGEAGYDAAKAIKSTVVELKEKYEEAQALIAEAERKGIEVSEEHFKLMEVRQSLINVRKLLHAFHPDTVTFATNEALEAANDVYQAGVHSIEEVKNRRAGFIVFSIISLLLAVSIYFWVKRRGEH